MITRKIAGIAILMVCVLLPFIAFFISAIIEAIKDVINYRDFGSLLALFWLTVVIVGLGLVMF